ncbi:hypothetical protein V0M98_08800 [Pseudomonas silesiensis]|uniref:hypothetical protein n=1 Tax=Pseudomonas silesiensis TaxID=1853130 RepID=UPI0030CB569C
MPAKAASSLAPSMKTPSPVGARLAREGGLKPCTVHENAFAGKPGSYGEGGLEPCTVHENAFAGKSGSYGEGGLEPCTAHEDAFACRSEACPRRRPQALYRP